VKWVEWGHGQLGKLENVHWMLPHVINLAALKQSPTAVELADESYFHTRVPGEFDRGIMMAAAVRLPVTKVGYRSVLGMKWVSSRVANLKKNLPRGEAITVLNDGETGLPILAYKSSELSLARTALVNCLALQYLFPHRFYGMGGPGSIALIGAGRVHRWQLLYMLQLWPTLVIAAYDTNGLQLSQLGSYALSQRWLPSLIQMQSWQQMSEYANVSLATSGATSWVPHNLQVGTWKVWLNTSLRDIVPAMIKSFPLVVVDDEEMAASQGTPYHRAREEGWVKKRCTLSDLVTGKMRVAREDYPVLVNPMGLAMWDVGLGYLLWQNEFEEERKRVVGD
jgi:ornithine cyclodeaminase/alanine dehydrogenase-like protein (mu-crystallin family)